MRKTYINYGRTEFDINKFVPISNKKDWIKPIGGFWASDKNASYSWKEFLEEGMSESWEKKYKDYLEFSIKDNANILEINSVKDLDNLPKLNSDILQGVTLLNFEELAKQYDAMTVNISSDSGLHNALYGWDVDSTLIFNPDIIQTLPQFNAKDIYNSRIRQWDVAMASYDIPHIKSKQDFTERLFKGEDQYSPNRKYDTRSGLGSNIYGLTNEEKNFLISEGYYTKEDGVFYITDKYKRDFYDETFIDDSYELYIKHISENNEDWKTPETPFLWLTQTPVLALSRRCTI